jgi:predicted CXXCH cytochrome family protein
MCILTATVLYGMERQHAPLSSVFAQEAAEATATPLPTPPGPRDVQCRGCHDEMTRALTLPSGETLPLHVDLTTLDTSPHSSRHLDNPIACTGCHQNQTDYRFPHVKPAAHTLDEYRVGAASSCESCHYPHLPFHDFEEAQAAGDEAKLPLCTECHGSHAISRVSEILATMPANCIACHADQSTEWAANFMTPRGGFGAGAEGYVGSTRCNGCHDDLYFTWKDTLHAKMVQDARQSPQAVIGDFSQMDEDRTFAIEDVAYTIGSRWRQAYITQTISNTFQVLPAQWVVATGEWSLLPVHEAHSVDWRQGCGSCHVTGLITATWEFSEFGIGCEGCHGPGGAHAADPENVKPYSGVDEQVCGACHSRGTGHDGLPFPATYRPGDLLTDHFTFTVSAEEIWPDGSARLNHQQYMDWSLGSSMAQDPDANCTTCHLVHAPGPTTSQLRAPVNDLCLECHSEQRTLIKHMPYHEKASQQHEFQCIDCHMPKMAVSGVAYDIHNHSLLQPNPEGSIKHGGAENMPNACNQCHDDADKDPAWATQMIKYAAEQTGAKPASAFGPGPTPSSPPPPTPIAAVGQPPNIDNVEASNWLRTAMWWTIGVGATLMTVLAVGLVALYRRRKNGETI